MNRSANAAPSLFQEQMFVGDEVDDRAPTGARFDSPGRV